MLVAAMNPCPCGYIGDERHQCTCTPGQIHRYRSKVSGPLLDRIDLHIEVAAVDYKKRASEIPSEHSVEIRKRVVKAREIQLARFRSEKIYCNGQMKTRHIRKYCILSGESEDIIETAVQQLGLSARAYSRILKVSRTIADLEGSKDILPHHLTEAIQYRSLDRGDL
jgi:magnesium chelatase family protein